MHKTNREWWDHCESKYIDWMHKLDALVLEVGSYNVNGSVRDHFHNFSSYTGVDFRPGPNVDEVCLAHDMDFDVKFDVVISSSMLEHDRHWRDSITNMESHLKDDGILLLSWGAANNDPHGPDHSDDGEFHALPAGHVFKLLRDLGMYIHEFKYEPEDTQRGIVGVVAFKSSRHAVGDREIDALALEDRI